MAASSGPGAVEKGAGAAIPSAASREASGLVPGAQTGIEGLRGYINPTNQLGHGNLPCSCDCQSGDCSVVRDNGGGPKAHLRLWPEGERAPSAARGGRWPSAPSQRRFHHTTPPPSRYKGAAAATPSRGQTPHPPPFAGPS